MPTPPLQSDISPSHLRSLSSLSSRSFTFTLPPLSFPPIQTLQHPSKNSSLTLSTMYKISIDHHDLINSPTRHVELDIDIGADARDWSAIQAAEKLKPVETELRRIEELVAEIVEEMEYLRTREQKLRDTNESTNERVKWFAFGTMGLLVGLGAWQVIYLRAYFRSVRELSLISFPPSPLFFIPQIPPSSPCSPPSSSSSVVHGISVLYLL